MPDEEKIGEDIFKEAVSGKKSGDVVLDSLQKSLAVLNREASSLATKLYESVFKRLDVDRSSGIIQNTVDNLSLVNQITAGLEPITDKYRAAYGRLIRDYREETFEKLADKEERIEFYLGKIDVSEDRKVMTPEAFQQIAILNEKSFRNINSILMKWKDKVYDLFINGINRGMTLISFRNSFYNPDGSIMVGSSLQQETTSEAIRSVTEQRTAFVRQKATENGYTYCWNANPMDPQTKPICMEASLAGVIPEREMITDYGLPPRFICRCEVVYTRAEWVNVNRGINQAISEKRKQLIDSLIAAPKQKASWLWNGKRIYAQDNIRRSGNLMYKETKDKLDLALSRQVPVFDLQARGVVEEMLGQGASMADIRAFREKYFLSGMNDARIKRMIDGCF